MPEKTYLPLQFARSMSLSSAKDVLAEAVSAYASHHAGVSRDDLRSQVKNMTTGNVYRMAMNPAFFTDEYKGDFPEVHRAIYDNKTFNKKYFSSSSYKEEWRDMLLMSCICEEWSKSKQVYEFDPDFVADLAETESLDLYPELLRRVPYSTFYIDHTGVGEFAPVSGVFIKVDVSDNDRISILLFRVSGNMYLSAALQLDPKDARIRNGFRYYRFEKDMIRCKDSLRILGEGKGTDADVLDNRNFREMAVFYIQAIFYLCSKKPDVVENKAAKDIYKPAKRVLNRINEVRKWDVGVHYGNTIRIFRKAEEEEKAATVTTVSKKKGKKKAEAEDLSVVTTIYSRRRPHSRRAHWHHYWVGKGKKKLEVRWLQPIFVGGGAYKPVCVTRVRHG